MLFYFAALMAAGTAALLARPKEQTNRWAALFLWLASLGGAAPWVDSSGWHAAASVLEVINECLTPWAVLIFCLVYSGFLGKGSRFHTVTAALLIPPVFSMAAAWISGDGSNYGLLLIWTAPYYLGACVSLILGFRQERGRRRRRSRLLMAIIVVPTLLAVTGFFTIAKALSPEFDFFRYVSLFIYFSMGATIAGLFLYGLLGIRLRLERDPLERAMRAASMGASMLNHSLKNEIGKISLSAELLRRELARLDAAPDQQGARALGMSPEQWGTAGLEEGPGRSHSRRLDELTSEPERSRQAAAEQLEQITRSTGRLLETVSRIQSQTSDINWQEAPLQLPELLRRAVERTVPLSEAKGVELRLELSDSPQWLAADAFHLEETVMNLLSNALEATPSGGQVVLTALQTARHALIRVDDTGSGIPRDKLPHIFDPFYSTKSGRLNYGIGLSYAHQAMRMAGGRIQLKPRDGGGTRAELFLSARRVLEAGEEG
ncbi:HAMP domain-containing histidine kinase [Paenibacillus pasadenensis]|uniref:sensor histidine kinase n=1 Tax=Paenibacillus pasadenensis TaxID=217090 RepID=UPI00203CE4BF|nr:HAMP domain-containing sensor histidine kinase [Paenibacillus pasadenensis]MCM3749769.1 HAMP domain-containing histidine kinase [Paenibacillus pasadenensis]